MNTILKMKCLVLICGVAACAISSSQAMDCPPQEVFSNFSKHQKKVQEVHITTTRKRPSVKCMLSIQEVPIAEGVPLLVEALEGVTSWFQNVFRIDESFHKPKNLHKLKENEPASHPTKLSLNANMSVLVNPKILIELSSHVWLTTLPPEIGILTNLQRSNPSLSS